MKLFIFLAFFFAVTLADYRFDSRKGYGGRQSFKPYCPKTPCPECPPAAPCPTLTPEERVCQATLGGATPSLVAAGTSVDVILNDNITYTGPITVTSTALVEVSAYTRTIVLGRNYPLLDLQYVIPFTGNSDAGARSRIVVFFDTTPVYDSTMLTGSAFNLVPLDIIARVVNAACGFHTVRVYAAVDTGTLNIPHYNPLLIEATVAPSLFGRVTFVGYN